MTRHHVFPRRHFRRDPELMHIILWICRGCHDDLETWIPLELQDLTFYQEVIDFFLEAA